MRAVVKKEPGKSFVLEDVKEPKIVNSKDKFHEIYAIATPIKIDTV